MGLSIQKLYWKEELREKIWDKHGVSDDEVEEVIFDTRPEVRKCSHGRYLLHGQSQSGRYLMIVLDDEGNGVFVPVTARDMTMKEKQSFKKRNRV